MVVRVSDKKQTYNNVTKLLVKPYVLYIKKVIPILELPNLLLYYERYKIKWFQ